MQELIHRRNRRGGDGGRAGGGGEGGVIHRGPSRKETYQTSNLMTQDAAGTDSGHRKFVNRTRSNPPYAKDGEVTCRGVRV